MDLTSESREARSHRLLPVQPVLTGAVPVVWSKGHLCQLSFAGLSPPFNVRIRCAVGIAA